MFYEITAEDIISTGSAVSSISADDLATAFNTITDWTYDWNVEGWKSYGPTVKVLYTREGDYGEQSMLLEAGKTEVQDLVRVTIEGQATALQYSENPDNDATYLRDVPYRYAVYVSDEAFCERVLQLSGR